MTSNRQPPPRPSRPPLNSVRATEAAARLGGFTKAATELHVSPAAIAQHVKKLERWCGRALFTRHGQGVTPTPELTETLQSLTSAFDELDDAADRLRVDLGNTKAITIAALPAVAQYWLSPRLGRVAAQMPTASVAVSTFESQPDLSRYRYDLALFYSPTVPSTWSQQIGDDYLYPVCAPDLADRVGLQTPADLQQATLIHDATWNTHWRTWLNAADVTEVDAHAGPRYSLYALALASALNGEGVLIGRHTLVAPMVQDGLLVAPFDLRIQATDPLYLTSRRDPTNDTRLNALAHWLSATT